MSKKIAAIILAAGKGKRMQLENTNKVTVPLGEKSIILHIVHFIKSLEISTIVTVVGHAKESVIDILKNENIIFAEQKELLGTGNAVLTAIEKLPADITDVFVVYGDDAVLYSEKNREKIKELFEIHKQNSDSITLLTIEQDNPMGLGRIVRDENGELKEIIEEKDATDEVRQIKEINPGCFIFSVEFLNKYLPKVEKSVVTGEYYLTSLIDLAIKSGEIVNTLKGGRLAWRGINTKEDLIEAENLYKEQKK